ncbi:hypothetical protein L6Q79_11455 [bacterium]|nr:hypothetical protein [bacterium]NUN46897.1 hypothetical protein [bacterium]
MAKRLTPPFFSGLVLDMGGSTTAVFQLINGKIIPPDSKVSQTHYKRIQSGRLIWIGTQTTPLEYLLKEVRIKGNKFHVIPRGVTFQSISTLLELLSTELSNQLSLFGALGSKKDAIRAIADTIDMDSTFFSTKEWQDIANQFYVAAIDLLSVEIRKAKKGFSKCKQAIVFGLGGETLCMPALMKTGIKKENIHIAKLLISEEMAIMSSAYGACHKATELFLKRRLPPVLSHN